MRIYAHCVFAFFIFGVACLSISNAQAQGTPAAIRARVSEQQLTTLKGNTHPLARAEFDQGPTAPNVPLGRMLLVLKRSQAQEKALLKLLEEQQQPGSANYHRWLTPEQFGQQFGAAESDIAQVSSWLESHGLTVNGVSNGRTIVEFSGTAGLVESTFHTGMHRFRVGGKEHWANSTEPQIPTALAPVVAGLPSLHNFFAAPQAFRTESMVTAKVQSGAVRPLFTSGGTHLLAPSDYAVIYNTNPLLTAGVNGAGVVIGVVARSNIRASDIVSFRSVFGLPASAPSIIVNGSDPGNLGGDEELEAVLDTSWAGAVAPGAKIDLVVSASTILTDGVTLSEQYIIDHNLANVMSESFGDCEANYTSSRAALISNMAQQAAAQGITYVVSSGDSGSAGCDNAGAATASGPISANILASTPYTIAVGGTQFNEGSSSAFWSTTNNGALGSAVSYIPEEVWNGNCTGVSCSVSGSVIAGGGGASIYVAKPSWQAGVPGIPADGRRDLPDVSLTSSGHDGYLVCLEGSCTANAGRISFASVFGTSAAAPAFGGIMALINHKTGSRQGQANPVLYRLAAAQNWASCNASNTPILPPSSCIFHDITVGTNAVPGQAAYNTVNQSYPATLGYDLASGLGSVNAAALANGWTSGSTVSTPPFNVSPAVGSGNPQTFRFTFSSGSGAANIAQSHMLFTGNGTGYNACYLIYQASNNGLYLVADNGSSLQGPVAPGSASTLSNSQCSVAASSFSVTPSGNTLVIGETINFSSSFAGDKTTLMYTFDPANVGSGWFTAGGWTVPGAVALPPFAVSPAAGSGAGQMFAYTFTSSAGTASSIWQGHMLITGNGTGNNACYLIYQASNNGLYLVADNGSSLQGPVTPGGAGVLTNSQCTVQAGTVSVTSSGNSLTVTESIAFKNAFNGGKNNMMYMFNTAGVGTGWTTTGTWTVTAP